MILLDIREVVEAKENWMDTREVMEESVIIVVEAEDVLLETGEVAEDPAGDNTNNSILPNFMNDSFIHDSDQ